MSGTIMMITGMMCMGIMCMLLPALFSKQFAQR